MLLDCNLKLCRVLGDMNHVGIIIPTLMNVMVPDTVIHHDSKADTEELQVYSRVVLE